MTKKLDRNEFIREYGDVINEAVEAGFGDETLALIGGFIAELENLNEIEADNPHCDQINVKQLVKNAIATVETQEEF